MKPGDKLVITEWSWSVAIGRDDDGNLRVRENGEPADEVRAIELYADIGGAFGWDYLDAADEAASRK